MSQVHKAPKLAQLTQPARPACAHRHAQAAHGRTRAVMSWAGLALSWPGPPAVSQRLARAPAGCAAHLPLSCSASTQRPCARPCHAPSALRASACAPSLQSQYSPIVLRYKLSPASLLYCNIIASPSNYIAIHLPLRPTTSLSQYTLLYYDTISLNQTSHLLQYTQLYCNTIFSLPSQYC